MNLWQSKYLFLPSLITLDPLNLETQVKTLEKAGFSGLHLDIIDGHFSPSLPLAIDTIRELRQITGLALDCHVMATDNDFFINELIDIGVEQIIFHVETEKHIDAMLNKIQSFGIRAGVALKPATTLSTLDYIIEKCDVVLLMLINPGFASSKSEKQVPYAEDKIKALKKIINKRSAKTKISIDGRISPENIKELGLKLVDQFVCGSTCLKKDNLSETAKNLMLLRNECLENREKRND